MKTCWVLSQDIVAGAVDPVALSNVAETWSTVDNWREYQTDNVVCHDLKQAIDLVRRAFHAVTTLYVPREHYNELGRPVGVKLYEGEFKDNAVDNKEDIVMMNLVSPANDIVLLYGFDLSPVDNNADQIEQRFKKAYRHNIATIIKSNPNVQYVLVDYTLELADNIKGLENLTLDSLDAVLELL
jgi:hypothetical protein